MSYGFRSLISGLAVIAVAAGAVAAEPTKKKFEEVTLEELGLTLIPPPGLVRNGDREAEVRKALPAFIKVRPTHIIFDLDPEIVKRDKTRRAAEFSILGTRVDTTGMTPDRQLRISNLGAGDTYFDTQASDIKIAGIPAKRFQFQQKPLVGEPVKGLSDGGVNYYFCRPGLLLSVRTRFVCLGSEKAAEQFVKDCDAAVATFKFGEK